MSNVLKLGRLSAEHICKLHDYVNQSSGSVSDETTAGIVFLYGSWNVINGLTFDGTDEALSSTLERLAPLYHREKIRWVVGIMQVDESEESLQLCIGDDGDSDKCLGPCPPSELPAIAVVVQSTDMRHADVKFVPQLQTGKLLNLIQSDKYQSKDLDHTSDAIQATFESMIGDEGKTKNTHTGTKLIDSTGAIRLFIAGDRSGVGKSSICLGLLGCLIAAGYSPSELAYIKPATQCEAPQLIETFCKNSGIQCVPVGPIVYFKGFTRAFLAGETENSEELLLKAGDAVDEVARDKRVVLIDGVGFPAVGSICGTDNASVARAVGYPMGESRKPPGVLLVGGSGVGAAVDAFNLNATYFEARNVPVIGAIFNKLSLEGFYSLENCKKEVSLYFDKFDHSKRPFGFIPSAPAISGDSAAEHIDEFFRIFDEHVDVKGIVEAAKRVKFVAAGTRNVHNEKRDGTSYTGGSAKRLKVYSGTAVVLTRDQIEMKATQSGAAASA